MEQVGSLPVAQWADQVARQWSFSGFAAGQPGKEMRALLSSASPVAFEWSIYPGGTEQDGEGAQKRLVESIISRVICTDLTAFMPLHRSHVQLGGRGVPCVTWWRIHCL